MQSCFIKILISIYQLRVSVCLRKKCKVHKELKLNTSTLYDTRHDLKSIKAYVLLACPDWLAPTRNGYGNTFSKF